MLQNLQYALQQVATAGVQAGLYQSLCTIQQPDGTLNASRGPSGNYVNVSGLVNLACMDAPLNPGRFQANELKQPSQLESVGLRHVLLVGYYPQISPATNWGDIGYRAVVDGTVYDILGAENDSQYTMTRLKLQKVTL